jgi:7,8-dihydroneopterin aldolase/epimerase/oxygenase
VPPIAMPTLLLTKIAFEGRHGATENERRSLQTFEVDIEIETPLDKARASDELNDTVDYRSVAEIIVMLGTSETHHLLESLAGRMLDALGERFPCAGFRLELRKLNPPACPGHPAYAAVRMQRIPSTPP